MRAISIGYHDVLAAGQSADMALRARPDRYALTLAGFREHLRGIGRANRLVATVEHHLPSPQGLPVFLTFDDGALGSYTCIADELERLGWRGHFFIVSDWIARPGFMDARQIRELRGRGHSIGSHSRSHPARMSKMGWKELLDEWTVSCGVLNDILGEKVAVASVPNGFYSRKVGHAAAAAGVKALFTSEPRTRISRVDECIVVGRYAVKAGALPRVSGAIAAGSIWPRWSQTVTWQAKKAVKELTGDSYSVIRRYLLPQPAAK